MKRRGRRWRLAILGGAVLLGAALVATALRPEAVQVEVGRVERGLLRAVVEEDGETRAIERYLVSAPMQGELTRVHLDPGDRVSRGEVLALLRPAAPPLLDRRTRAEREARLQAAAAAVQQAEALVGQARVAASYARQELTRRRQLAARGALAERELDLAAAEARARAKELASARFAERVAQHERELARAALERSERSAGSAPLPGTEQLAVTAPIDGQILRVLQDQQAVVAAGAPLLELADTSALEVVVDLLSRDAVQVKVGAAATLLRWGGARPLAARVDRVEPAGFTKRSALGVDEQRVNVVLQLLDPPSQRRALGHGFQVDALIELWRADDVLQVPSAALFRRGRGWASFVIKEGRARLRWIEVGRRGGTATEVRKGLVAGEAVVLYPGEEVEDGARLRPSEVPAATGPKEPSDER